MALTANKNVPQKASNLILRKIAATEEIFRGAITKLVGGYLEPASAEAGALFGGIAYEGVSNAGGADGAEETRVLVEGLFKFKSVGLGQADVGKTAYASDDETVSATDAGNEIPVGSIEVVESATVCWVRL